MLLLLLSWIYISVVCFTWGALSVRLIAGKQALLSFYGLHWPLICLTGLAVVGTLSFGLSVFMPVGLAAHLLILIPVILFHLSAGRVAALYRPLLSIKKPNSRWYYLLLASALLLVLIIASYKIDHPDTLKYMGPAIRWMELYKAIPGIVHFNTRFAYQSSWFSTQALFRFSFISNHPFLFTNSCILFWFFVFILRRIDDALGRLRQDAPSAVYVFAGWLLLLAFSVLSWTQVRLTAASTSPDFVATLYAWAAFYLLYQYQSNKDHTYFPLLITLLSCAAVSCKLSVIVLLLVPAFLVVALVLRKAYKTALVLSVMGVLVMAPSVTRSIINTGYPLYPSTVAGVFNPDWKASASAVEDEAHYISAYARFPVSGYEEAKKVLQFPATRWIPAWWAQLTLIDKALLLSLLVLLAGNLVTLKKQVASRRGYNLVVLLVSMAGCLLWFLKAPSPRFGTGLLVPFFFSLSSSLFPMTGFTRSKLPLFWYELVLALTGICMLAYVSYRGLYFFETRQLVTPLGTEKPVYQEVIYKGIPFYLTGSSNGCGFCPSPCVGQLPSTVVLRGDTIEDGFKEQ